MGGFVLVLVLALLPAAGNFLGGLGAELVRGSGVSLSLALHLAAGIVLAVVGLELVPAALAVSPAWVSVLAFAAGGAAFLGVERGIDAIRARLGADEDTTGPLAVFAGVALDLFSDGVMIGTATVLNPALAFLLAIGQVPADIPEGFAAIATLRRAGIARRTRILLAAGFMVPVLVGAALGYLALRSAPELVSAAVLALTGGLLTAVVIEEMVSEAHDGPTSKGGPLALTVGFSIFAVITVYTPS